MPIEVADLVATIRADLTQLTSGLNKADTQIKSFAATSGANLSGFGNTVAASSAKASAGLESVGKSAKSAGTGMNSFYMELAAVEKLATAGLAAIGGLAVGLFEITKKANEASGKLYDMSVKTGVAVPVLSALKFGAEESGISFQRVGVAITQFEKKLLSAAAGSKSAQADLARFDLTAKETSAALTGNITPALEKVLDRIGKMPEGAAKAGAEMKIFGRTGADISIIMQNLGNNIGDSIENLKMFGLIISQEAAEKAKTFNNALFTLEAEIGAVGRQIAENVGPVIVQAIQIITEWFVKNQDTIHEWAVRIGDFMQAALMSTITVVTEIRKQLAYLVAGFKIVGETTQAVSDLFGAMYLNAESVVYGLKAMAQAMAGDVDGAIASLGTGAAAANEAINKTHTALATLGAGFRQTGRDVHTEVESIEQDFVRWMYIAAGMNANNLLNAKPAGEGADITPTGKGKQKDNGLKQMMDASLALQKAMADEQLRVFKSHLEDERAALEIGFADKMIGYRTYYAGLDALAQQEHDKQIEGLKKDREALIAAQQQALTTSMKPGISDKDFNEAVARADRLGAQILKIQGQIADSDSHLTGVLTKDANAITKQMRDMKIASEEAHFKLLEALGGDSASMGKVEELDSVLKRLEQDLRANIEAGDEAAAKRLQDVQAWTQYQKILNSVSDAQRHYSDLVDIAGLREVEIRRQISLGLIADKDAQETLNGLRDIQITKLNELIKKQQELIKTNPFNAQAMTDLMRYEGELQKLKDSAMGPLASFLKGLRDSNRTFMEDFKSGLEEMGKSLKQTLGNAFNSLFHGDVKGFFHGLVTGFRDALAQMAAELLAAQFTKLLTKILGAVLGGIGGGLGGGLGGAGAPTLGGAASGMHFAGGGILPAGQTGIFGENGPERFISLPGGGTRVFSNPVRGGGNVTHVHNWYINTPDAQSFMGKESQTMIQRRLSQTVNRGRKVS